MQIVIDIPEKMYENALNNLLCGSTILCNAIKNGTPLPNGHGDLIDRDLLRERISEDKREAFTKHEVWLLASKYNTDVPVVVKADKENV